MWTDAWGVFVKRLGGSSSGSRGSVASPLRLLSDARLGLPHLDRVPIVGVAPPPREEGEHTLPEAHHASRRHQHDDEEDRPDQRVEARPDEIDALRVVIDDDEEQRADPGALEPVEAADDGDYEQVDRRAEVDRRRVAVAVPPDEQAAGERRHERAEREPDPPGGP